jgi:hypothetical protein
LRPPVAAQVDQTEIRADDGTTYQILTTMLDGTGAEELRITTVGGAASGIGGCNVSQGVSGQVAEAIAGALPPGQTLHPYDSDRSNGDPDAERRDGRF